MPPGPPHRAHNNTTTMQYETKTHKMHWDKHNWIYAQWNGPNVTKLGSRAFAVAAPDIWNRLPPDIIAADSLSTFHRLLKRFLFRQSYPDVIYWHHPISGPCSGCATQATLKIDKMIQSINQSAWTCYRAPHPKLWGARNTVKIQQHNSVTIVIQRRGESLVFMFACHYSYHWIQQKSQEPSEYSSVHIGTTQWKVENAVISVCNRGETVW